MYETDIPWTHFPSTTYTASRSNNHHSSHSISFCPPLLPVMAITLVFVVQNRNITGSSPHPPPHTCTHATHQIRVPLGHAFFCLPDWQTHIEDRQDCWMMGLGSRELCTTTHTHTHEHTRARHSVFISVRMSELWAHWELTTCLLSLYVPTEW